MQAHKLLYDAVMANNVAAVRKCLASGKKYKKKKKYKNTNRRKKRRKEKEEKRDSGVELPSVEKQ